MKKRFFQILKITSATIAGLLLILFLLPVMFPGKVVEKVKAWTNKSIDGEINFSKVRLSFFNHFPSLTVTLHDVSLKGSAPFKKDTLLTAREIALGIDIKSLVFDGEVEIDEIYLSQAGINVLVNKKGEANYNIYVPAKQTQNKKTDSTGTSLKLEKIEIGNTVLHYNDESVGMFLNAKDFNYTGNGQLSKDLFNLYSDIRITSLDVRYENEPYLINKKVEADLITRVNTQSLSFIFEKNKLMVNRLPLEFSGKLDFLKNGYDIDFTASSVKSNLDDVFTAFPPQYLDWQKKTEIKGRTDFVLMVKGPYIISENKMPDLSFDVKLYEGFIRHDKAPLAVSDLYIDMRAKLPSLNTDLADINADTLSFKIGDDYLRSVFHIKGLKHPDISGRINASLDLEKADRAFGFSDLDMKGKVSVEMEAKGIYHPETKSLPVMQASISINEGVIKTAYYPNPINNINLKLKLQNPAGTLKDMQIVIEPFSFVFEGKPFNLSASLSNLENIIYNIKAKGEIDVAKVYKVFAVDEVKLKGFIQADLALQGSQSDAVSGNYTNLNNAGTLKLADINIGSSYFPLSFLISKGLFTFRQDKVWFDDFRAKYGSSDFTMNGHLKNLIEYALSASAVLQGNFKVHSNYINVNEFASPASDTTSVKGASMPGVVIIPPNYNLSLNASASKLLFDSIVLDDLGADVSVNNGTLSLKSAGFGIIGCKTVMDLGYYATNSSKASFDYHIVAKDFDVKKAYDSIAIFRALASAAANAQGIVSVDYKLKGVLDENMQPIYPSLEGGGVLSVKDIKVSGLKLFAVIAQKVKNDSINNPNLRKINIKSSIKNNVITVERFRFKVFGFRPRIEGKTNFDGQLDLRMRLGLPPLGIIGIPIKVSGTQDDPVVKLGRRNKEEVKETIYNKE